MDRRSFLATSLALAAAPTFARSAGTESALEASFRNPPKSARPHTWWHWMNGNITRVGITADLEAMAQIGIGGAQIFNVDQGIPLGPVDYFSAGWRAMVVHAAKEAKRVGIELCFHNCAGWSSSGGPWITPEYSMQMLTWSETAVAGGAKAEVTLPEPPKRNDYYADIAVIAFPTPANNAYRTPDIRGKAFFERADARITVPSVPEGAIIPENRVKVLPAATSGTVTLDLPAGNWTVLRMGHTSTGETNHPAPASGLGLECDKLSAAAMDLHWEKGVAPLLKDLGPELVGTVFNNALIDSYEVGTQNWTPRMREEFQKRCGYEILPFLVTVTGRALGSAEKTERFLWDLRRTSADLFAQNYTGRFREHCHENKLLFSVEPYGNAPMDNLQVGAMADIIMGEFWVPDGSAGETAKIAASAAHTTGRQIVGAESFTANENDGRWQMEPYAIKALGDRMFTQGINRYIFHRFTHQPWIGLNPGMTMGPWGSHFDRTQTWWKQGATWLTYVARCQYLLQSGHFVADVLTFSGDDAPGDLYRPELPPGYDFDGCSRSLLTTARVEKGDIVLPSGARYRVLMIPESGWLTPETTAKLAELSQAGATIVGRKPAKSPSLANYPACDAKITALAGTIRFTPAKSALPPPDVTLPRNTPFVWLHRRTADAEIYFVSNQRYFNRTATVGFRVTGRAPELWHPETGKVEAAPIWQAVSGKTNVTLNLAPAESVFVVFRKGATASKSLVAVEPVQPRGEKLPVVEIRSAHYEAVDGAGGADVTAKVKALVAAGESEIRASNQLFGDPISMHVKHLRVRFTLNGKSMEKTAPENGTILLMKDGSDIALPDFEISDGKLLAYTPGSYKLTDSRGTTRKLTAPTLRNVIPLTDWSLTFPGQSPRTLKKLVSWTTFAEPDAKYFSGTASYKTTFHTTRQPGIALILDLGAVKNFADILLNGKPVATLWKAPWRLDISKMVQNGTNTLEVRVTNFWVNRLIGDEQLPPEEGVEWTGPRGPLKTWPRWIVDGKPRPKTDRVTFSTWRFWTKDDTPLDSGILGPARLLYIPVLDV